MDFAVETRGLTRRFGGLRAVDSLDLRVKTGSLYGFLGRNGAGKSTTIKMLTGILAPTAGEVFLLGTDISDDAAAGGGPTPNRSGTGGHGAVRAAHGP